MKEIELPQFIKHNGYCNRKGGRANGGGDIFQLYFPNPATHKGKDKLICYGNPLNTTFEVYASNINDGVLKLKELIGKEDGWEESSKEDFIEQWGEKDLNWFSKIS